MTVFYPWLPVISRVSSNESIVAVELSSMIVSLPRE